MTFHVLVTHGTDTMAWCLAYLTYALKKLPCNVAITGSQLPLRSGFSDSDATANLESAVRLLGSVRPPSLFAVFNRGAAAFGSSMAKADKWDPDAFIGRTLAEFEEGDPVWSGPELHLDEPHGAWHLHILRTGGTIESERDDFGLLVPTGNVVSGYLTQHLENLYHGLTPHQVCSRDSSDMAPELWLQLAERVAALARDHGAPTRVDAAFSARAGIVWLDPWKIEGDYRRECESLEGIVVAGYGGGNVNLDTAGGRSAAPALREALRAGKPVVLASQVTRGAKDFVNRKGHELREEGTITGGGLALPHLQTKLAYLLGHREALESVGCAAGLDARQFLDACMTAGMPFRNRLSRERYSRLKGFSPLDEDPFFNREIETAAELVRARLAAQQRPLTTATLDPSAEVARALRDFGLGNPAERARWAVILKPDSVVGRSVGVGAEVDAAQNLASLLEVLRGYRVLLVDLFRIGLPGLAGAVRQVDPQTPWPVFLRQFGFLAVEGGRQSVWDPASFDPPLSHEDYVGLLAELALARGVPNAGTGLFICLGHQGYAAALARLARRLLLDQRDDLLAAVHGIAPAAAAALAELLASARQRAGSWQVLSDHGEVLASDLWDARAVVHPNERPEALTVEIRPYLRGASQRPWPVELVEAYDRFAAAHRTPTESVVSVRNPAVAMLHGDEVEEGAIYFLHWLFRSVAALVDPILERAPGRPPTELDFLRRLPVGLEITSSTRYRDFVRRQGSSQVSSDFAAVPEGDSLTEVGSLAIHYRAACGPGLVHDTTVQFHPELLGVDRVYRAEELRRLPLDRLTDGIRILAGVGLQ